MRMRLPIQLTNDDPKAYDRIHLREGSVEHRIGNYWEAKMTMIRSILSSVALLSATFVPLSAQWLHYPTPGIPRTPDGKPNLSAPAPKTPDGKPDLSGIWMGTDDKYFRDLGADGVEIPMLPWAAKLYKDRKENLQKGHP